MILTTRIDINVMSKATDCSTLLNTIEDQNTDLRPAQKELLIAHNRLCHADMQRIQSLTIKRKK